MRNKRNQTGKGTPDRMQAEDASREFDRKLRRLFESTADGIYAVDLEAVVTEANGAFLNMYGYRSRDDVLGKNAFDLIAPRDVERVAMEMARTLDQGGVARVEFAALRVDGSEFPVEASGTLLVDAADNPVGFIGGVRDITERRQAEESLLLKEKAIEHSVSSIAMSDMEGKITYVNRACLRLWGSEDKKELLGKPYWTILKSDDGVQAIAAEMLGRGSWEGELVAVRKDGTEVYAQVWASLVKDDQGNPVQTISSFIDITERKWSEEALRESEEKYRSILEGIEDGYYEVDIAGNFTFFNDQLREMIGYPKDKMMGMNNRHYMDKENARRVYQAFNRAYTTGKHVGGFDWEITRKDGSKRLHESSVSLRRNSDGKPIGFRGIVRDITERRKMEQQLLLSGRLAAVGELAAGVAHELNNPLAAVQAFAQFLADRVDLDETTKSSVDTIYKEAKRATRITSNLLSFARKHEPERSLISINEVIEKSLELHIYRMKLNNIEIVTELDPDLPMTMADYHQMQQVFANIITNADQAMTKEHGRGKLVIKTHSAGETIQATFTDDGPGIPKDNLSKLFDPFFTTKDVGEGTGLGLSICYGIVHEHGGHIYAESKAGEGAIFVVEIPAVSEVCTVEETDSTHPLQSVPRLSQ